MVMVCGLGPASIETTSGTGPNHVRMQGSVGMTRRIHTVQIDEAAVGYVCGEFNAMNWQANELKRDYGIDLHVKVLNRRLASACHGHSRLRSKAPNT